MRTRDQIALRLRHNLWQEEAGIMFIGYQARETLGRGIISHRPADLPRLVGEDEGENIFLVHGKEDPLQGFANAI